MSEKGNPAFAAGYHCGYEEGYAAAVEDMKKHREGGADHQSHEQPSHKK